MHIFLKKKKKKFVLIGFGNLSKIVFKRWKSRTFYNINIEKHSKILEYLGPIWKNKMDFLK